jgi:DNA-binding MarR family transcriptional regulator
LAELDKTIHAPVRLRVMAALKALAPRQQLDFRTLRETLALTDGNLGAHLQTLAQAGYIRIEKSFVNGKPRTHVSATPKGRARFDEHVQALREICDPDLGNDL